jgi:hypothetical protein
VEQAVLNATTHLLVDDQVIKVQDKDNADCILKLIEECQTWGDIPNRGNLNIRSDIQNIKLANNIDY